ncbi:MRP-L47-domain-containing protein [Rostrohypoxylon terebratum]|nr:MRP-L47-domain-containing protein [Rostrohypoxylon terebratum]
MAMASSIRPSIGRILNPAATQHTANPFSFLTIFTRATTQTCSFSTTPELNERRPRRDNNRLRGLSSLYRSGPRARTNIEPHELPKPSSYKKKIEVDPNHGLWGFFYAKDKLLPTPDEIKEYGRAWSAEELRQKGWEDLHSLWWVCCKEQNRLLTAIRVWKSLGFQRRELLQDRMYENKITMKRIRHVLTERFYLWEDARALAVSDPEINLADTTRPYNPSVYYEEQSEEPVAESSGTSAEQSATEDQESAAEGQKSVTEGQQGAEGQQAGAEGQQEVEKSAAEKVEPSTSPTDTPEIQQPPPRI